MVTLWLSVTPPMSWFKFRNMLGIVNCCVTKWLSRFNVFVFVHFFVFMLFVVLKKLCSSQTKIKGNLMRREKKSSWIQKRKKVKHSRRHKEPKQVEKVNWVLFGFWQFSKISHISLCCYIIHRSRLPLYTAVDCSQLASSLFLYPEKCNCDRRTRS